MKTELIIAILIYLIILLTCLSIHYSSVATECELNLKTEQKAEIELNRKLNEKQLEVNRLKAINTSLKKDLAEMETAYRKVLKEKSDTEWQEYRGVKITAYCPCQSCSEGFGNVSCTGEKLEEGMVAVDKNVIPLGSEIVINGKTYVASDVGGGIEGLHIDIYMESHEATEEFGVQTANVKVKRKNDR